MENNFDENEEMSELLKYNIPFDIEKHYSISLNLKLNFTTANSPKTKYMELNEPVEGFNDYKESLFAKLIPAIDELVLVRIKLDQLKAKGVGNHTILAKTKTDILDEILFILKQENKNIYNVNT